MSFGSFKKALAISAALVAPMLAGNAHAQDWRGAYGGVNIGQGWGGGDTDFNPLPSAAAFVNLKPTTVHTDPRGFVGGFQLGYNFAASGWLFGVEADLDTSNVRGSREVSPIIQNNGTPFGTVTFLNASYQTEDMGSLRLRLGRSVGSDMYAYIIGGGAAARVQYSADSDFRPTGTIFYKSQFTKTETGFMGGAGLEWGIGGNWSMRAEYTITDLGDESRTANPTPANPPFQVAYKWSNNQQAASFGLNYHF